MPSQVTGRKLQCFQFTKGEIGRYLETIDQTVNLGGLQANGTLRAGYLRLVWEMSKWLYGGQHGFRPGYSCESQIVRFFKTRDSGETR
jgi:hypothetical protein